MVPDGLKTRARRVVEEALNQGDLAVANELISPDCVHHVPGGQSVPGLAALRDFLALTLSIFPDFHAIVEDEIAEDDRVVRAHRLLRHPRGRILRRPAYQSAGVVPDHRDQPGRGRRAIRRALVIGRPSRHAAPALGASRIQPDCS